ncbi:MAG: sugar-binding protein, partial [Planctomycetota bacterium]
MLAKKCLLVGIFTLLSLNLVIADPPAVHPATGEPLVIDCLRGTPDAIDGDLSDWNLEAMTPAVLDTAKQLYSGHASWTGPEDSSGEFYLLWDDVNIYIAVVMKDDKLSQNKTGSSIWNADAIEVFFSRPETSVGAHATVHYQYGFDFKNQKWNWCNMDGSGATEPGYLQIASSITADGYICEASIEHGKMLSLDFVVGNTIGFHPVFDDTDNGDRELQMTWTSREAHDQSQGFGHMFLSSELAVVPELSKNPSPADDMDDVSRDTNLSWDAGCFAATHNLYFGTLFDDVNTATVTDGKAVLLGQGLTDTVFDPGRLEFDQTYYWRVDEVNAPPTSHVVFKGDVWSFTVEPFAYAIENITATASSSAPAKAPENTINGSGLDESGLLHGKEGDDNMWLSGIAGPQPTWIKYEFDKVYKLHELWVWNSNEFLEPMVGFGFKDVTIEYSVNGADYTTLGATHEFAQAPGTPEYAHNTTVVFGGIEAKYVRLTAHSNWGGLLNQYGLSEVRFFYIPVQAREPSPDSGATDVSIGTIDAPADVTLGFRAGREAATHNVYFSTDQQAVADGTAAVTTVTETSYGPLSLDLSQTYYWRVDEVNEAETPTTWQGDLWDFKVQEYFVVDDIESYNDLDPGDPESKRIFNVWIDGYGIATNGSLVGYEMPPFCERTIVHGDKQSMPLAYNNTGGAAYSEAERTFAVG